MYDDLLTAVKTLLTTANRFGSVAVGIGRPTAYPAASIWLHKGLPAGGHRDPVEELTIMVQIQGYADDDTEQSYLDMLALVAAAKQDLHQARIGSKGARSLQVQGLEAMRMEQGGPTVYLLTVTVKATASDFTLP